jgi:hypothetical protein
MANGNAAPIRSAGPSMISAEMRNLNAMYSPHGAAVSSDASFENCMRYASFHSARRAKNGMVATAENPMSTKNAARIA